MEQEEDQDHVITTVDDDCEATCWGCGSRLLLPSYVPIFKCGWCGAITNQTESKYENKYYWWRRARDRSFVCVLLGFIHFVICGGVWAVYPVVFGISYVCGIFNSVITFILSISTLSTFSLAAFRCAGEPQFIEWGSYPAVRKGQLDNYTFCHSCSKPKPPRAHHCRSCEMCILDMDHHCPFIGNCVGAANHRHFIAFLSSAIIGMLYLSIMAVYTLIQIWPPVSYRHMDRIKGYGFTLTVLKEIIIATLSSAVFLPAQGLLLVYLLFAGISVEIGLMVLLWQQLQYIYEGKTYLSHLISTQGSTDEIGKRDCNNLVRFFGCPFSTSRYLPCCRDHQKRHKK